MRAVERGFKSLILLSRLNKSPTTVAFVQTLTPPQGRTYSKIHAVDRGFKSPFISG